MHPATEAILRHFRYDHLPPHLRAVSKQVCDLAYTLAAELPDDPEKTVGLRHLLYAKDAFVRAALPTTAAATKDAVDVENRQIKVTFTWSNGNQIVMHEPLTDWFEWHDDGELPPTGVFNVQDEAVISFLETAGQADFHPLQDMEVWNHKDGRAALSTVEIDLVP
jgi:hypothetical protein